jgi:hypothetical protein
MPHFTGFIITEDNKRQKVITSTSLGHAVAMVQSEFQNTGAKSGWVETDGADDPVVKFKIGEQK